ncbi:type I glyceraldehyde-3-phosphate dehydrogenase [Candidatus Berkelbacteria bacterium]|nr:type I glyceraldehyde-3-phosphate dehydrogenase [Candidatus Berkelbacteria bacterium]
MLRVAINGFGRIGRVAAKIMQKHSELELVAVNDLGDAVTLAHLLKYDTVYGRYEGLISANDNIITIDGKSVVVLSEKEPDKLPWGEYQIDVVIEATGKFTKKDDAAKHLQAGAKAVVISAPSKGENPAPTFLRGVNDNKLSDEQIINNASCTTNSIAPAIQVLEEVFGVERALMTTVHGYTSTQHIQDGPHKDLRRGRAAAANIIPTSTGAAVATTEAIPTLKGRFDGLALRVPVINGSLSDITAVLKKEASVDEVNAAFIAAASTERYQGVLTVTNEPIVSSDIIGDSHSATIDLELTRVNGNLVKVFVWYDNEFGYASRLVEMVERLGAHD